MTLKSPNIVLRLFLWVSVKLLRVIKVFNFEFSCLLSGLLSGLTAAMGLGGGAVLIIYLTLFAGVDRITAGGINLLFFIPISLLAVIIYAVRKEIKWKTVIPISLFGLLGAILGMWLIDFLETEWISKIFGGILIIMGLKETFF